MRRALALAAFLLALALAWWLWPRESENVGSRTKEAAADAPRAASPPSPSAGAGVTRPVTRDPAAPELPFDLGTLERDFPIVAPLNRPEGTLARDLTTLAAVFDAWRTNFPRDGNPVGENRDITAALAGENNLGFALIPKNHPAINTERELCDRWGTPFRFHQLSGQRMEIRSAGPDRKFATEDDGVWTPP